MHAVADTPAWHDIPLLDWRGQPVDCAACAHQTLQAQGGCQPGRSCMQDAYARRIDRFFRAHRELAREQLRHPYFEVRAIAARYADPFQLPALLHDPDETVRLQVALRVQGRFARARVLQRRFTIGYFAFAAMLGLFGSEAMRADNPEIHMLTLCLLMSKPRLRPSKPV